MRLIDRGILFNEHAKILFEHASFRVGETPEAVDLVRLGVGDLGISQPAFFADIVKKAEALGLSLCPLNLGAFLRLEYLDQAEGPYLIVASLKPESGEDIPNGFYLRNIKDSLWLRGYKASDDYAWPLESEFVFLATQRPRNY